MFCSFSTVGVALGALTVWHAVLISRGETSIERHINMKEAKRMAKRGKVSMINISNAEIIKGCDKLMEIVYDEPRTLS